MSNFRHLNPASLTPAQRIEHRDAVVGVRYSGNRTDLEDGSCYYANADGPDRYVLHAFAGKALRPAFIEAYRTRERLDSRIAAFVEARQRKQAQREQDKAARRLPHTLKVGDVLNTSWGYEQTNCEFYEVVAVRGSHVLIFQLVSAQTDTEAADDMTGALVPVRGKYLGEVLRRRASSSNAVRVDSTVTATPWNGSPVRVSSYH